MSSTPQRRRRDSLPRNKKRNLARVKARQAALKAGLVRKGDQRDVHHKDSNPLNNDYSNLMILPRKKNRGMG